jgi:hypothetical protein
LGFVLYSMQKIEWDYYVVVGKYNQNAAKHTISDYILSKSGHSNIIPTIIYNIHIHRCLAQRVFILYF